MRLLTIVPKTVYFEAELKTFPAMIIFLTGFMGSGKSYTARQLGKLLGWPVVDLDQYMEQQFGQTIAELFDRFGEAAFRKMERQCLQSLARPTDLVVATGGGTPCFFDNMKWMNEHGLTIFLDASPKLLYNRLAKGQEHRPLIAGLTEEGLQRFIEQTLEERRPFYQQAAVLYFQHSDADIARELVELMPELSKHQPD